MGESRPPTSVSLLMELQMEGSAATAVRHLRSRGVRVILLKGPVTRHWLYRSNEARHYGDLDFLVSPHQFERAASLLGEIGYQPQLSGVAPAELGVGWANERVLVSPQNIYIDLHQRLIGVPSAERCWDVLSGSTEPFRLQTGHVEALTVEARALHLALHAAQDGLPDTKALADLDRGLQAVPLPTWRKAAQLAESLDATPAFAAGLRLLPEGAELADGLRLPHRMTTELAVRMAGLSQDALFFERLKSTPGLRAAAALIWRKLFPTAAFLRARSPLARRGPAGLLLARTSRVVSLMCRLPPAAATWLRAQRRRPAEQGQRGQ